MGHKKDNELSSAAQNRGGTYKARTKVVTVLADIELLTERDFRVTFFACNLNHFLRSLLS